MDFRDAFDIGRAISHGVEGLKRQPLGFMLGGFLLALTEGGGGGGGNWGGGGGESRDVGELGELGQVADQIGRDMAEVGASMLASIVGCALVCTFLILLFRSWILVGYLRMQRDMVVEGSAELGTLFRGGDAMWRLFAWILLAGVVSLGTAMVAAIPGILVALGAHLAQMSPAMYLAGGVLAAALVIPAGIYVTLGLSLGNQAVVLEDMGAVDALERSWSLASGNRLHLLLFFVVLWIVKALGYVACCVGVFATRPVVDIGTTSAYLLATREDGADFALMRPLA